MRQQGLCPEGVHRGQDLELHDRDLVDSSPAVVNGVVYVGSNDHKVYALKASTGTKIWSYTTGDSATCWILPSGGQRGAVRWFFGDNNVYAFDE